MSASDLLSTIERISRDVAAAHAADVDLKARFPSEAISALREVGVMGAAVPVELGGLGCDIARLTEVCTILGRGCTSTAMIVAMHHIQVLSLVHHAMGEAKIRDYLRRVATEQRLIASGTSEVGPSGDMRQSVCHVVQADDGFGIEKQCTTVSYGQYADDILFQGRRSQSAGAGDQVTVLAVRGTYTLEQSGSWDTLGMRGTCSAGGRLSVHGESWQILAAPFAEVAAQTMTPTSHILWSGCWLGAAEDAVAKAGRVIRAKAKKSAGQVPPDAYALSSLTGKLQLMRSVIRVLMDDYTAIMAGGDRGALESVSFALRDNNLKLNTSGLFVEIVSDALRICGIAAYKNDSELSLGRHLRDAHSAPLMINNQRIHATNAAALLVHKNL